MYIHEQHAPSSAIDPASAGQLISLAESLLYEDAGIRRQMSKLVARLSGHVARLVSGHETQRDRGTTYGFPVPVRFGGREYGTLLVEPNKKRLGTPALSPARMHQLAQECGVLLYLLEQHALVAALFRLRCLREPQTERLTKREQEILALLAQGQEITSLAARLSISPRTLETHLGNIYQKLGAHNPVDAVLMAYRVGLTDYIGR